MQKELIRRLARAEGVDTDAPFGWHQERYGRPSTYDDLLEPLTRTAEERQALLRSFVEPDEEEREAGQKARRQLTGRWRNSSSLDWSR